MLIGPHDVVGTCSDRNYEIKRSRNVKVKKLEKTKSCTWLGHFKKTKAQGGLSTLDNHLSDGIVQVHLLNARQ